MYPFEMYVANGCYWEIQYDMVVFFEQLGLQRTDEELTAVAGYAGGNIPNPDNVYCYNNYNDTDSYYKFGMAEAVGFKVNSERELTTALDVYFRETFQNYTNGDGYWQRKDIYDQGPENRAIIGMPGGYGVWGDVLSSVNEAIHNMTLIPGSGNDPDTFQSNSVYVYDSNDLLFHQAEICMQFHDNVTTTYPPEYHALKDVLVANRRLQKTGCPKNFIC